MANTTEQSNDPEITTPVSESYGYWYTEADGTKCWTEDFEQSIGE